MSLGKPEGTTWATKEVIVGKIIAYSEAKSEENPIESHEQMSEEGHKKEAKELHDTI
jgi:hypothetical protein